MAYSPFDLTGKVALVTGGNRGIGWGIAEALAQAGAQIAVWGRTAGANEAAVSKLRALGVEARGYAIDVSQEEQVLEGMADTLRDFGRVDSVFANAAVTLKAPPFIKMPTQIYRDQWNINLEGAFFTLREACKHMVERSKAGDPGGSLIGVASLSAIAGGARYAAYSASKGALVSMMKSIAVEHARYGVRANSILPGFIETDMMTTGGSPEALAKRAKILAEMILPRLPAGRWGRPADFGGIAVYLASDASRYQSGAVLAIDGGYSNCLMPPQ